jgi:hypothetical protein
MPLCSWRAGMKKYLQGAAQQAGARCWPPRAQQQGTCCDALKAAAGGRGHACVTHAHAQAHAPVAPGLLLRIYARVVAAAQLVPERVELGCILLKQVAGCEVTPAAKPGLARDLDGAGCACVRGGGVSVRLVPATRASSAAAHCAGLQLAAAGTPARQPAPAATHLEQPHVRTQRGHQRVCRMEHERQRGGAVGLPACWVDAGAAPAAHGLCRCVCGRAGGGGCG